MSKNFALPSALGLKDGQNLEELDDAYLHDLIDECDNWFAWTHDMGSALTTVAGKTEWKALMRQDTADVAAVRSRLQHEINARTACGRDHTPDSTVGYALGSGASGSASI